MSSHHPNPRALLNPATRSLIERVQRAGRAPMAAMTPEQARAFYDIGGPMLDLQPAPSVDRVQDIHIPARDGHAMPARLYAPHQANDLTSAVSPAMSGAMSGTISGTFPSALPVLLYLHGGGFSVGSLTTHDVLCRQLSRLGHCAVVSLAYRLAPEHRFPTAVHDSWDALNWLQQNGHTLGLNSTRLAVGGDSAGGTLAAVCALMARDAGLKLALQLLFYPGTVARQNTDSHHRFAEGFMLDKQTVDWFFANYIDDAERDDWRFAPLNAPDHAGLAPAWIGLAECDPLVDEGVLYADTLRLAGVPVDLEIYKGVVHGFITMGRAISLALHAHADAGRALRAAFDLASRGNGL